MNDEENQKDDVENKLKKEEKEKKKKPIKKKAKKLLIKSIPFIAVILIAMILVSCLTAVVTIVFETLQNVWSGIVNFFTGSQTYFELNDEQIDALIQQIESTGIDLEDLELLRRN